MTVLLVFMFHFEQPRNQVLAGLGLFFLGKLIDPLYLFKNELRDGGNFSGSNKWDDLLHEARN